MTETNHNLKTEIWRAAEEKGVSRTEPKNAFIVAQRNPQGGWYITPARTYMDAEEIAGRNKVAGVERYVVSANEQHALLKVGNEGRLIDA